MDYNKQFDSLSEDLDGEIDETFFQWCIDNEIDYSSDEKDYPDLFKEYFIKNCTD